MDEKERNALLEAYSKSVEARMNTVLKHMQAGVKFVDASSAYIDESVEIGAGTVIGPPELPILKLPAELKSKIPS